MQKKRILLISSRFAWPDTGASQQDCAQGVRDLIRLGFEVRIIAHTFPFQEHLVPKISKELDIPITAIPYQIRSSFFKDGWKEIIDRCKNPLFIDGATYEYSKPEIRKAMIRELDEWKPDAVLFDFSFCWPLYPEIKRRGIPIITRAQNYEAGHYLDENGISLSTLIKFIPKYFNEKRVAKLSDKLWAITPDEKNVFTQLGAKHVEVLPLRSLPSIIQTRRHVPKDTNDLHVVFLGSTYNMRHNRFAAELVIKQIAPMAQAKYPNTFTFHILGKHLPERMKPFFNERVIHEGYVENLNTFLDQMDIALCPSLLGHGMQQKVFEPLSIGIPVITSPRVIAGFPFVQNKDMLLAKTPSEFVVALGELKSLTRRQELSANARSHAEQIFSQQSYDQVTLNIAE